MEVKFSVAANEDDGVDIPTQRNSKNKGKRMLIPRYILFIINPQPVG